MPTKPDLSHAQKAAIAPHPLDHAGLVKIALGQAASDALKAAGEFHLVLVSKADCTAPQAQGRMVLLCLPLDKKTADDAAAVALGRARAVRIRTPKIQAG